MPYVRLDISQNLLSILKAGEPLKEINSLVAEGLKVPISKVKTVVTPSESFLVGDGMAEAHAYITVQCFKGRPVEVRGKLSSALYEWMNSHLVLKDGQVSLSVYICEIDAETTTTAYNRPKF